MPRVDTTEIIELTAAVLLCEFTGFIGSIFTAPSIPVWYLFLRKPTGTPPAWVFAPVWIILFALMGVSLFLIWRKRTQKNQLELESTLFSIQIVFNVFWSIVFFTLHSPFAALITIGFLWIAVFFTMAMFFKVSRPAGYFLIPYLLWVSYAIYLNAGIWLLN